MDFQAELEKLARSQGFSLPSSPLAAEVQNSCAPSTWTAFPASAET